MREGGFYPPEARTPEARLRYYAEHFPLVEVDSTYYAPPTERNAVLWVERTPSDFTFNVKAYSLLTGHPTRPDSLPRDLREELPAELRDKRAIYLDQVPQPILEEVWRRFHDALMPLHSAGKLGAVLFQFPRWFVIGGRSKDHILECAERLRDFRIAVEFRHRSWLEGPNAEETLAFLGEHRLPFVCVDMPQGFDSSLPPIAAATAEDLAMVRFHGRNREAWSARSASASERFRYDYSREELAAWVPKVRGLAEQVREVHVLMNNCYRDYAIRSARLFRDLLEG